MLLFLSSCARQAEERQAAVERRSEQVMPFSMSDTMHIFTPTSAGGVQSVMVDDSDPHQIALVQKHLHEEAIAFAHGDFSDPAYIHGNNMPGLAELRRDYAKMSVTYTSTNNGARIVYYSDDPKLVAAVHEWFSAQVQDHGAHASMGM
jgi:hypothetical protein